MSLGFWLVIGYFYTIYAMVVWIVETGHPVSDKFKPMTVVWNWLVSIFSKIWDSTSSFFVMLKELLKVRR